MKRDLDLVKKILLALEEQEHLTVDFTIPNYDKRMVSYHIMIMEQADLLEAQVNKYLDGEVEALPKRLTWQGHEWLDLARNNTVWEKVKKKLEEKAVGVSFEIMKWLLAEGLKQFLSSPST